jgi:molybdopterin synthase catalytic subunit
MFLLTDNPLNIREHVDQLSTPEAGACVTFEGWVRNHNEGKEVLWLEYEAYDQMAVAEGRKILEQALVQFDILEVLCVHRVGRLKIGDIAVWVGVSACHRKAAFAACEKIMDEIKSRVPIWKKEHYADGNADWVLCKNCATS